MKNNIALTNELLEIAAQLFNTSSNELSYIGGSQNIVYEYEREGASFILRFTPSANRSESLVQSELDWMMFLANAGIAVSLPTLSNKGRWTEVIHFLGGYYTCVSFEKAQGKKVEYPDCLQHDELHEQLGRLTGRLHALSKTYRPQEGIVKRQD